MTARNKVIESALHVEKKLTKILMFFFRFDKNPKKYASFDGRAMSLTAKHRLDLLQDLHYFEKGDYAMISKLLEIRNKFAHELHIGSFESLRTNYLDLSSYLTDKYNTLWISNQGSHNNETRLSNIWDEFQNEVLKILDHLLDDLIHGAFQELERIWHFEIFENQLEEIILKAGTQFTKSFPTGHIEDCTPLFASFIKTLFAEEAAKKAKAYSETTDREQIFNKKGDGSEFIREYERLKRINE